MSGQITDILQYTSDKAGYSLISQLLQNSDNRTYYTAYFRVCVRKRVYQCPDRISQSGEVTSSFTKSNHTVCNFRESLSSLISGRVNISLSVDDISLSLISFLQSRFFLCFCPQNKGFIVFRLCLFQLILCLCQYL